MSLFRWKKFPKQFVTFITTVSNSNLNLGGVYWEIRSFGCSNFNDALAKY